MDKFPLFLDGKSAGELTREGEALYTWFEARCRLPEEGLWCAWAVGVTGELRLGVLEPAGERAVIRRRFSKRLTEPLGTLLRGEARPLSTGETDWKAVSQPEELFHTLFLRQQLQGATGALVRETAEGRYLALPWNVRKPFFLTGIFCFTRIQRIGGREYAVFTFDREERPMFR